MALAPAPVYLRALGTAVPVTVLRQEAFRDVLAGQPGLGGLGARRLRAAFDASAVDTRHTVMAELGDVPPDGESVHFNAATSTVLAPSTGTRDRAYVREAPALFLAAAKDALSAATWCPTTSRTW